MLQNLKTYKNVNQSGMGLGLTICSKLVHAWHGTISCKSEIGMGTKFTINLPINV